MKTKIKFKLTFFVVSVSLFCYIVSCMFFYLESSRFMEERADEINVSQLQLVKGNIDQTLKNILEEVNFLAGNNIILNVLNNNYQDPEEMKNLLAQSDKVLNDFVLKEMSVDTVNIIRSNSDFVNSLSSIGGKEQVYNYESIKKILQGKELLWIGKSDRELFLSFSNYMHKGEAILLKKINNISDNKELGIIVVRLKNNFWEDILLNMNVNIYIVDSMDNLIYKYGSSDISNDFYLNSNDLKNLSSQSSGSALKKINGTKFLISSKYLDCGPWRILSFFSIDDMLMQLKSFRKTIFLIALISFVFTILFSFLISHMITEPINNIGKMVTEIKHGNIGQNRKLEISRSFFSRLLRNKYNIVFVFSILVIVPIVFSLIMMQHTSGKYLRDQSIAYYKNMIEQVSKKVEVAIQNYNHIANYIFGDKDLNQVLLEMCAKKDGYDGFEAYADTVISQIDSVNSSDIAVALFDNDKNVIYSTSLKQKFLKEQLAVIDKNVNNSTVWFPTVYDCGTYLINFGKRMVAFDNLEDIYYFDNTGYIVLTINEQLFEKIYMSGLKSTDGTIYIMDANGGVISHSDKSLIRNVIENKYLEKINDNKLKNGFSILTEEKGDIVLTYSRVNTTGWIVIGEIPLEFALSDIQRLKYNSTFLFLIIIFIIITSILFFVRRIINQIVKLNDAMCLVSEGNTSVQLSIKTGDEIQKLADGFNSMVYRLEALMKANYNQGLKMKEAELNALQAQINPHFLYNTLESINWEIMMITGGPNKASEMLTALSDLLRISINRGKEIVTLEDEINHVKNYLKIQKERYIDKFDTEWDIDPELYKYKTLKLILQPLVENSIYHGLELKEDKGLIIVRGQLQENSIKLEILDDGIGMNDEQLEAVRRSIEAEEDLTVDKRSIGIRNVHERIKLYFGKEYGIRVHSEEGEGTRVEIYLPLFEGEINDKNE